MLGIAQHKVTTYIHIQTPKFAISQIIIKIQINFFGNYLLEFNNIFMIQLFPDCNFFTNLLDINRGTAKRGWYVNLTMLLRFTTLIVVRIPNR